MEPDEDRTQSYIVLTAGTMVSHYRIVEKIGAGGMGVTSFYHLARAYEASGWIDKAVTQYKRFLEIWKNADSGIVEIEDARDRLARLKNQSAF